LKINIKYYSGLTQNLNVLTHTFWLFHFCESCV